MHGTIVPADGRLDAQVAIVGARPGRDELRDRRGFVGASGQLLWRLFKIPRVECYVTNVRKDFSTTHDTPTRSEIHEALPSLRDELSSTSANIFIAIGADAFYALTGKSSIDKWRGSVVESSLLPGRKVLGTWHTAYALRQYSARYVIDLDLKKAARESRYPEIRRPQREFTLNPPFEEAREYLRNLGPIVAGDIETFGDQVSCVGLSDHPSRAICIPFFGGRYTTSELAELWRELDVVFRTRELEGQNFQFDVTRLERCGFRIKNIGFDTMLAHHLLWTELGSGVKRKQGDKGIDSLTGKHSLAFISSIYTDEPFYKDESEEAWDWTRPIPLEQRFLEYWGYNCKDACVTRESSIRLRQELERFGQTDYFHKHVMSLIRPIMHLQDRGMCVDQSELTKVKERIELETAVLQGRFNNLAGFECNVKGTNDLKYLLFDKLKFRPAKLTKSGKAALDEETIRTLAYKGEHGEIFRAILEIRERRTLLSNFLSLEAKDGRYKAAYLIHGTDSGRLSSRAVAKGPQLQNIPRETRKIFIPAPGNVFVNGDLSRAEAMHVAYVSGAKKLIELFEDPTRDLYKEVAADALGLRLEDILKDGIERQTFKVVVLGSNYDMGPLRFVTVLRLKGIDIMRLKVPGFSGKAKAEYVQDRYFTLFPEIKTWQQNIAKTLPQTRCLTSSMGRRRMFLGRMDDYTIRAALSYDSQATVAAITNGAVKRLDDQGWELVSQVHDSVKIECKRELGGEAAEAMREAMTQPLMVNGRVMTIPVDITWSDKSWGHLRGWG
jgi:uracil-DNA glycosylase family 4